LENSFLDTGGKKRGGRKLAGVGHGEVSTIVSLAQNSAARRFSGR